MDRLDILNLLANAPELDGAAVAERLNGSREAASMLLLRLVRQGLVRRELDPDDGVFFYSLTPKGIARRRYLNRTATETGR
jgi:DNA-binding MarR family transcriptional regulator